LNKDERDALIRPRRDDLLGDSTGAPAPGAIEGDQPGDDPRLFGDSAPDPDPVPVNHARLAIHLEECETLIDWIYKQAFPIHRQVTAAHLVAALSGMVRDDLRWLCYAMNQANRAPAPSVMRQALIDRDVAILRD
jgi:hypothetical protein